MVMTARTTYRLLGLTLILFSVGWILFGKPGTSEALMVPVQVVSDPINQTNSRYNLLTSQLASQIKALEQRLVDKEYIHDPKKWQAAKQAQDQLTGAALKWTSTGDKGEATFVTNYSEEYKSVADQVAGDFIFGDELDNFCSEKTGLQIKVTLLESYKNHYDSSGKKFQCALDNEVSEQTEEDGNEAYPLATLFETVTDCTKDPICASYEAGKEMYRRIRNAQANEAQIISIAGGYRPVRVCRTVTSPSGGTEKDCPIVTPPSLIPHTVNFALGELPAHQLLNTDEYNENVSTLMSNLSNYSLANPTGVLGLGGHPDFANNIFGADGNLSYADALVVGGGGSVNIISDNPIDRALKAEIRYAELQQQVVKIVLAVQKQLDDSEEEYPDCFDLKLDSKLTKYEERALKNLEVSSTTKAILLDLNKKYKAAKGPNQQNAVLAVFENYKAQGYFRTDYDNSVYEIEFIKGELKETIDEFVPKIAAERARCETEDNEDDGS